MKSTAKNNLNILNILYSIIFLSVIILPLCFFNSKENAVSKIDNKVLKENPLISDSVEDFTEDFETYLSERIGFRDQMIKWYTIANDKLFGEMVHPTYMYGKDGYVFFKAPATITYNDYHVAFADAAKEMQDFCNREGVPFLLIFEPSKIAVMSDKLPNGYCYDRSWVYSFRNALEERGVNYIDNYDILYEKYRSGEAVFNKKYNAGHWNDLGAFYGMNNALANLQKYFPSLHNNMMDEYDITQKLNTSLMVSEFPIEEYEPIFNLKNDDTIDVSDRYRDSVIMNSSYRTFLYYKNPKREREGAPSALVFQGSYIDGMGYKFLKNVFSEYVGIHVYQNLLNFKYYYDMFKPDCVIVDVAEYTMSDTYFDYETLKNFNLSTK
jgi:hypothetical protein